MNAVSVTEEIMDTRGELMRLAKKLDQMQANADGQQQPQPPKHVTVDMGAQAGPRVKSRSKGNRSWVE